MANFNFLSICVQKDKICDTNTTIWIGQHVPIDVSISSNLIKPPTFPCSFDPEALVESFVSDPVELATPSKAQRKLKDLENNINVKSKHNQFFSTLNQRRCRKKPVLEFEDACIEEDKKQDVSTKLLKIQKNQHIELQNHLERYCTVPPVFGFNSSKEDFLLRESKLLPLLFNERGIEPIVIKKANQFVSFKFGDVQLLDISNILEAATSLDSFL